MNKKTGRPISYCKKCMSEKHLERLYADDPEGLATALEKSRLRASVPDGQRWCSKCGKVKPLSEFYPRKTLGPGRLLSTCKMCCSTKYHAEADLAGERNRKRKYGLPTGAYDEKLADQDGVCAICKRVCKTGRGLAVDHDHKTGAVRGLLCSACNNGLGRFDDDAARLLDAAQYLLSYSDSRADPRTRSALLLIAGSL